MVLSGQALTWLMGLLLAAPLPPRPPDLVEIVRLDPTIRLDIRYATDRNFAGRALYTEARAFLQRPVAASLVRANKALQDEGYGLLVFDAYRPLSVTQLFWEVVPKDKRRFVANPRQGSMHNRGCAVDLSLYALDTGREIEMPSAYDEMTARASPDYKGGTPVARAQRDRLRRAMEQEGFAVNRGEWWHFDHRDCPLYDLLDVPFDQVR